MCRRFALDLEWDAVAGPHNRRRILARRRAELRHCVIPPLAISRGRPAAGRRQTPDSAVGFDRAHAPVL